MLLVSVVLFLWTPFIFAFFVAIPFILGSLPTRPIGKFEDEDICPFSMGEENDEALERRPSVTCKYLKFWAWILDRWNTSLVGQASTIRHSTQTHAHIHA